MTIETSLRIMTMERDKLAAELARVREACSAAFLVEMAMRRKSTQEATAEAIAEWIDATNVGRDDDPSEIAAEIRDGIRSGLWRNASKDQP